MEFFFPKSEKEILKIVKGLEEENCKHIQDLMKEQTTKVLYFVQLFIEPTLLKNFVEKELNIKSEELKEVFSFNGFTNKILKDIKKDYPDLWSEYSARVNLCERYSSVILKKI
jgi:hypothetical protein